jgi:hypothetical protein
MISSPVIRSYIKNNVSSRFPHNLYNRTRWFQPRVTEAGSLRTKALNTNLVNNHDGGKFEEELT